MLKRIILSAISILILAQICIAQSGNSAKENTSREAVQNKRRIKELINERDNLKMFLADYARIQQLPDIEKKQEEYEKKLEQVRRMQVVGIPAEIPKKYGDDWRRLYSKIRGTVSGLVIIDMLDSDMEVFPRMIYTGTIGKRAEMSRQLGVSAPITEADKYWEKCKDVLVMRMNGEHRRLCQLQAKYDIPDIVVRHAEEDSRKELHRYAYKYLVELFSKEKIQESKTRLERVESQLHKYPEWKEIEQELLESLIPDSGKTKVKAIVSKRIVPGQVIETKVYHNAPGRANCLDVETASILTPPLDEKLMSFRWLKANGIDFSGLVLPDFRTLYCIDSRMAPAANELWDVATVDLLKQSLKKTSFESPLFIETERRLIMDELPVTYVFQTGEGSIGILQILKVEVRKALDIRYKILAFGVETEKIKAKAD